VTEGDKPVSREAIVASFAALVNVASPKIKLEPMPVSFDAKRVKLGGSAKSSILTLIRDGYVAPFGPLATNKANELSAAEFGDALGHLLLRISDLTHTPSTRWSPMLQSLKRT